MFQYDSHCISSNSEILIFLTKITIIRIFNKNKKFIIIDITQINELNINQLNLQKLIFLKCDSKNFKFRELILKNPKKIDLLVVNLCNE